MAAPKTHYIRLGPIFDDGAYRKFGLRTMCGLSEREHRVTFIARNGTFPATCKACVRNDKALADLAERVRHEREITAIRGSRHGGTV